MTDAQAGVLWEAATGVSESGRIVEIGSFRGRSAIVLARAAPSGVEVVAIDPHAGSDRGPQEYAADQQLGDEDHQAFVANLRHGGVEGRVRHVRLPSQRALGAVEGSVDLLYVDGAHRYAPARDDIARWGARVPVGGTMLIHDAFSAVGVTLAQLRLLFLSRRWRYCGRTGTLAQYSREPVRGRAVLVNALRQAAGLPYFVRNELVKVLLLAHLRPLTRLLGHTTGDWPH